MENWQEYMALLIAALSAYYSRRAVLEAKSARNSAEHLYRREIYINYSKLRDHYHLVGVTRIELEYVNGFTEDFNLSKLYIDEDLHNSLLKYINCIKNMGENNLLQTNANANVEKLKCLHSREDELVNLERELCNKIDPKVERLATLPR